jgi:thiol:disulfide interchange protein DsbG
MMIHQRRRLLGLAATLAAATFAAPARAQAPAAATAATPAPLPPPDARAMLEQFEKSGRGFDMRPGVKGATTVYVVFDPQCPWCAKFWDSAKPIADRVRFVWLPVAVLNPRSEPQGAAILSSANPVETMEAHEALLPKGGLPLESLAPPMAAREDVWSNSRIYRRTGGRSVPFAVYRDAQGQAATIPGYLSPEDLKKALGLS